MDEKSPPRAADRDPTVGAADKVTAAADEKSIEVSHGGIEGHAQRPVVHRQGAHRDVYDDGVGAAELNGKGCPRANPGRVQGVPVASQRNHVLILVIRAGARADDVVSAHAGQDVGPLPIDGVNSRGIVLHRKALVQ